MYTNQFPLWNPNFPNHALNSKVKAVILLLWHYGINKFSGQRGAAAPWDPTQRAADELTAKGLYRTIASREKMIILEEPRRRRWAAVERTARYDWWGEMLMLPPCWAHRAPLQIQQHRDPGVPCEPAGGGWMWGHVTCDSAESFKTGHLLAMKTPRRWSVYSVTINSQMKQSSLIRFKQSSLIRFWGYEMCFSLPLSSME